MRLIYAFARGEDLTQDDYDDLLRLMGQLTDRPRLTPFSRLSELTSRTQLLLVRDYDHPRRRIVASSCLVPVYITLGFCGRIEDVVADASCRGQRVGDRMLTMLIAAARVQGMSHLELTSNSKNPERAAAIRLYTKHGFTRKETDCFRLKLS